MKKIAGLIFIALLSAFIAVWLYSKFFINSGQNKTEFVEVKPEPVVNQLAGFFGPSSPQPVDLTKAAENSVKGVVHVQTLYNVSESPSINLWDFFFGSGNGYQQKPAKGYGSGVIISEDGYIVTNNHVIKRSDNIQVVLNDKRIFNAELAGQDATTDLALLKIDADELSILPYGNSDKVKLGEWALAVGNPYNLTSTVTAGIISAKARSIGINTEQMSIESFIQTDAAVNPGNSGGALVNSKGELIGINTAIQSRTGAYSGYSFAIPVNIVKKVVKDLKEFGAVQRAFIGVNILTVDANLAKEKNLDDIKGVYVSGLAEDGAAKDAGIQTGDVILAVNTVEINSNEQLMEQVSKYRPGDNIDVLIKRNRKTKHFDVELRNSLGSVELGVEQNAIKLGAEFSPISQKQKWELQIENGVQIVSLKNGLLKRNGVNKGFIITKINNTVIYDESDIKLALGSDLKDNIAYIYGIFPNGRRVYYTLNLK